MLPAASRRLRRQRGFTLIEMLVVISILGILAGIVTAGMVGLDELASRRADDEELMTVQSAMNFMLMDQVVDPDVACSGYTGPPNGTSDMAQFPSSRPWAASGGRNEPTAHQPVQLYRHYLRGRTTRRLYRCTGSGTVVPVPGS